MGAPIIALECPVLGNSGGTAEFFRPELMLGAFFNEKEYF